MKLGEHQEAFMEDLEKLLAFAREHGYKSRGRELQRTIEQQKVYIQTKRSTTMNSNHLNSTAIDIYFFKNGELVSKPKDLGDYWESLSPYNSWGGNWNSFKDNPHFERRAG